MSRVQLALNVNDLDSAIAFYTSLFGTPPAKVREGYANFAIAEPPLKLVLIENPGQGGTLNHLGVEVMSTDEVTSAITRLQGEGLATRVEEQTTCCFAVQDKVWVHGPDAEPWEVYTVLADATTMHAVPAAGDVAVPGVDDGTCCTPAEAAPAAAACCTPVDAVSVSLGTSPSSCC
ncbi:MAG: ArsI/CadI family heavy metal resistance metalloenzyme [Ilumatobacteraceae bacterium]